MSAQKRKTVSASKGRVVTKKGAARDKRSHTTGAVAAKWHEGSRSEIIADVDVSIREKTFQLAAKSPFSHSRKRLIVMTNLETTESWGCAHFA